MCLSNTRMKMSKVKKIIFSFIKMTEKILMKCNKLNFSKKIKHKFKDKRRFRITYNIQILVFNYFYKKNNN